MPVTEGRAGTTDDQLRALGRLVAEFSFLELMVGMVIWGLLDKAERRSGVIFTSQLPFARLCQTAEAIAQEKMKGVAGAVDQLQAILGEVRRLEGERNRLVHSLWLPLPDDPSGLLTRLKITARVKLDFQFEAGVPPADLNRVADEMNGATLALVAFLKKYDKYTEPTA